MDRIKLISRILIAAFLYGKAGDEEENFKVLDRAWELGSTFWDTAEVIIPEFPPQSSSWDPRLLKKP